jgi:phosphoadenosine phosphosulfate reductase
VGKIDDTIRQLEKLAEEHDAVGVAYSDGKDSRVVMDLAVRTFKRVEAFYMYLVPDLDCINNGLREAEDRWGVKVHQLPHESLNMALRNGIYCDPSNFDEILPDVKLRDIYTLAKVALDVDIVLTGAKSSDSSWRRRYFHAVKSWTDIQYPIKDWNKHDVLGYLNARNIPVPDSSGMNATGIALIPAELCWLWDNHPNDFRKVQDCFPYVEACIYRREFHGT